MSGDLCSSTSDRYFEIFISHPVAWSGSKAIGPSRQEAGLRIRSLTLSLSLSFFIWSQTVSPVCSRFTCRAIVKKNITHLGTWPTSEHHPLVSISDGIDPINLCPISGKNNSPSTHLPERMHLFSWEQILPNGGEEQAASKHRMISTHGTA